MKKIAIILLLTTYSLSNLGMVVNAHFCGGHLISASFIGKSPKTGCGFCGMKNTKKDCCKDTLTKLTADDNHQLPVSNFISDMAPVVGFISEFHFAWNNDFAILNKGKTQFYAFETGPPKNPIYLQLRTLLI